MSFLCDNCGASFEDPSLVREYQGEHFGAPAYELWQVCPACGSEDIGEERDDWEEAVVYA